MRSSKPVINILKKVKDFNAAMKLLFSVIFIAPLGPTLCIFLYYYFFPSCYFIFDFISRYNLISCIFVLHISYYFLVLYYIGFCSVCCNMFNLSSSASSCLLESEHLMVYKYALIKCFVHFKVHFSTNHNILNLIAIMNVNFHICIWRGTK